MARPRQAFNTKELLRAALALAVILGVLEIGFRLGIGRLGSAVLFGAVAVVELYRRLQRHQEAS
ncbi:MAG: hypothetical protein ACJ75Q_03645 [Gaiellaceae bacterium]|jgi:lipid-binding SYLF domain-containing protein